MNLVSTYKLMSKVLVIFAAHAILLTIPCFQVKGLDKEKAEIYEKEKFVFEPIVGNGHHGPEIEKIHESAKELFSKLTACTKNQKKCEEFDELTTQIESNFAQGNHLSQENEQYIKLQQAYNQFKFTQENHFDFGEDSHLFQPLFKKLTEEEKKIPFEERFSKKYIGKVPRVVDAIMFYLQNYEKLSKTKLQAPNQILLHGRPATGKNHLVKTIAEELELPIIEINITTFSNKYYEKNSFQNFFENLEKRDELTTVFIDDIDIIANAYSQERAILLTKLEKIKNNKKVFIFCATNNIKDIDPALKSRFITAEIKQLSLEERAQLFKKSFADNGEAIDDNFATKLAHVTSEKSKEFSEYSTTRLLYGANPVLRDYHINYDDYKQTKYHPSEFIFDNRDIGNIAIFTLIKQQRCLKENSETGKCFQTCQFAEKAIRQMNKSKSAKFDIEWKRWCYDE